MRRLMGGLVPLFWAFLCPAGHAKADKGPRRPRKGSAMRLPRPRTKGMISLEQTIQRRRTIRAFSSQPVTMEALSQLLWAAQGTTDGRGFKRAAPSAGALYPMDLYAVAGSGAVEDLDAGVYHYESAGSSISLVSKGDLRRPLARAALSQMWLAEAPLALVIAAEYARATGKYGERGVRYAVIEAGHIGQNVFLQAEALNLSAGIVGAFQDGEVIEVLGIPRSHEPLLIMPVGYKG